MNKEVDLTILQIIQQHIHHIHQSEMITVAKAQEAERVCVSCLFMN